ncbi:chlorophyll a-b binding protein 7, chloroplastic-like [Malania oleifera]|uniref:chlorophyll a-b binding protein 7, chloroplastic-like n=1 Tax=Malania oleifera TaxID=397392 RepID=UPI0025ADAB90|nr:chlorophyll a-b binding protein 7, chloroplastic-like [Malania oleifera]
MNVPLISSQKSGSVLGATKASFFGRRKLRARKYTAPTRTRSLSVCAAATDLDRPLWFPGSTPPPWLDSSLPGDFGFDPLGLGSDAENLRWNQQAELVHCRWAMLGVAACRVPEMLAVVFFLIRRLSSSIHVCTFQFSSDLSCKSCEVLLEGLCFLMRFRSSLVQPGRIEHVQLNKKDGVAKVTGTALCVAGATVITLYLRTCAGIQFANQNDGTRSRD